MTARLRLTKLATVIRKEHKVGAKYTAKLEKFGSAVRHRRLELRMSRRQLAEKVGISYGQLSKIELGENWPTVPVYLAICRVLRCARVPLL